MRVAHTACQARVTTRLARVTTRAYSLWGVSRHAPTARWRGYLRYAAHRDVRPNVSTRLCAFGAYGSLNSEYDVLCEISNIYILFHIIPFWNNVKYDDT